MKQKLILPILLLIGFCSTMSHCKKNKPPTLTELEKLPPITQEGKNTFGCLINDTAYVPHSSIIFDWILKVQYDPTYANGNFNLRTRQIIGNNKYKNFTINLTNFNNKVNYFLQHPANDLIIHYLNENTNCEIISSDPPPPNSISGKLTITKFDQTNRIIAGSFDFEFNNSSCGTIKITNGRFDVKY